MDIMEQLLCPQVCMDVDDTPLTIENPVKEPDIPPEADSSSLNEELRVRMILDGEFVLDAAQIPNKLLKAEEITFKNLNYFDYLEKAKVHCTVCQKHIGTSPVAQFDRYIHPDLNTLLCHACYKFYGSGEFEKDEDGSEIYCKWCAQGGTVMCCSECPLVFCQQCVRKNLGNPTLSRIKSADTWKCFKCFPEQLTRFHLTCAVLHEYSKQQIQAAILKENILILKSDISTCCKAPKRKRKVSSDDENDEFLPNKPKQKITKTPDAIPRINKSLPSIHSPNPTNTLFQNLELQAVRKSGGNDPLIKFVVAKKGVKSGVPTLASLMPNLVPRFSGQASTSGVSAIPKNRTIARPLVMQSQATPEVKQSVTIKHRPGSLRPINAPISQQQAIRIAWLINSISESKINVNGLLKQANEIQIKAKNVNGYSELAVLHNKMQHAIAQCAHSLIETRKNMHKEFLKYLKRMNVTHTSYSKNGNTQRFIPTGVTTPSGTTVKIMNRNSAGINQSDAVGRPITAEIDLCDDDDDDGEIEEYPIPMEKDPLMLSDDEDEVDPDMDYDLMGGMLQPEIILTDDPKDDRVVDDDFEEAGSRTFMEHVNLINSDDEIEESRDQTDKAYSKGSLTSEKKKLEEPLIPNEENSLIDNDVEHRETAEGEKTSEVPFVNTKGEEDTTSRKSARKSRKKRRKSRKTSLKEKIPKDSSIPGNDTEQNHSIVSNITATSADDDGNSLSGIIGTEGISQNLRIQFDSIYTECVSINTKICYDLSEMSYDEFMRAITVKIILNHQNPKLRVEARPTAIRSTPFLKDVKGPEQDLLNETKDIQTSDKTTEKVDEVKGKTDEIKGNSDEVIGEADKVKGKADEVIGEADEVKGKNDEVQDKFDEVQGKAEELDDTQDDTCSSKDQYESCSTNEPEDTCSTNQHDDTSSSDQEDKDTSEEHPPIVKKSSFDFVQQMQNENSQTGTTGSPSSLTPDEHNLVDSTIEHLNNLISNDDKPLCVPVTQNTEEHSQKIANNSEFEGVPPVTTSIPYISGNVPSISTDISTVSTDISTTSTDISTITPVTAVPLVSTGGSPFSTAVPQISPAIPSIQTNVPPVSTSVPSISPRIPPIATNIPPPPVSVSAPPPHSVPEFAPLVFNHSLHMHQTYNPVHPGQTFNDSALPPSAPYDNTTSRALLNDHTHPPMPQQAFNSALQLQPAYNRISQPQVFNNPVQHQSTYNRSSPGHSPYNTPPQNYSLYNNPQIRPPFNDPHSSFNPAASHIHPPYNNPPAYNPAYNNPSLSHGHSSFNNPLPAPPFNNPPQHFSTPSQLQPPFHPINIQQPPLSFNNPTYIPPQPPLAHNDYPATTSSSDFNERGNRGSASGTPALDTTPPAICLEDMIKIYEACDTSIDGDMVPTDE